MQKRLLPGAQVEKETAPESLDPKFEGPNPTEVQNQAGQESTLGKKLLVAQRSHRFEGSKS